jgi:hypothetical protein
MVPSFVLVVVADGEHLTCGGFSLGKTVHLGSFEFITDYFDGLSLSPRRGDSGATFMGSTRNGTSSPWLAMTENSAEEFLTTSSGEGGLQPLLSMRHGTGAPPAPVTTTPWMENTLTTQAITTVPPWTAVLWPDTGLPFEQRRVC